MDFTPDQLDEMLREGSETHLRSLADSFQQTNDYLSSLRGAMAGNDFDRAKDIINNGLDESDDPGTETEQPV